MLCSDILTISTNPRPLCCLQGGEGVLRLLLQPWESREVAVVFTPSEHKPTTTILLIRYTIIVTSTL